MGTKRAIAGILSTCAAIGCNSPVTIEIINKPMLRQVKTLPGIGQNWDACNLSNLRPGFAPLDFDGQIEAYRVSAMVRLSAAGSSQFGMAIYRSAPARFDRNDPVGVQGVTLQLVTKLPSYFITDVGLTPAKRYNASLTLPVILDSTYGQYYIGFVTSDRTVAQWYSPQPLGTNDAIIAALDARHSMANVNDWPVTITTGRSQTTATPHIVVRSPEGVYLLGGTNDD